MATSCDVVAIRPHWNARHQLIHHVQQTLYLSKQHNKRMACFTSCIKLVPATFSEICTEEVQRAGNWYYSLQNAVKPDREQFLLCCNGLASASLRARTQVQSHSMTAKISCYASLRGILGGLRYNPFLDRACCVLASATGAAKHTAPDLVIATSQRRPLVDPYWHSARSCDTASN